MLRALRDLTEVEADVGSGAVVILDAGAGLLLEEDFVVLKEDVDHHFFNFAFVDELCLHILDINLVKIFNWIPSLLQPYKEIK